MATANPFDLLGDNDNDDPSQLIAAQQEKIVSKKAAPTQPTAGAPQQPKQSKLPSKPLPPAQAGEFFTDRIKTSIYCLKRVRLGFPFRFMHFIDIRF